MRYGRNRCSLPIILCYLDHLFVWESYFDVGQRSDICGIPLNLAGIRPALPAPNLRVACFTCVTCVTCGIGVIPHLFGVIRMAFLCVNSDFRVGGRGAHLLYQLYQFSTCARPALPAGSVLFSIYLVLIESSFVFECRFFFGGELGNICGICPAFSRNRIYITCATCVLPARDLRYIRDRCS